ncbi:hypothetical protein RSSM_05403 [Rhodopirellula sallentina SM41]|uniref:Uncharacterized protein n=1 Tax=Rhodopirellula sallentina SM41 TaxID=1263870 RepID=M5TVW7_9BACT|nr:hypothetical protein RSSM_05403 [Rhodopirellula sallentina SM41]
MATLSDVDRSRCRSEPTSIGADIDPIRCRLRSLMGIGSMHKGTGKAPAGGNCWRGVEAVQDAIRSKPRLFNILGIDWRIGLVHASN